MPRREVPHHGKSLLRKAREFLAGISTRLPFSRRTQLLGLFLTALTLAVAYAGYILSRQQASSQLSLRDPQEQAIEVGEAVVFPIQTVTIALVSPESVTCGHVLRVVNTGGVPSSVGEVVASLTFGPSRQSVDLRTSQGAALYDSWIIQMPSGIRRIAFDVLRDEPWPMFAPTSSLGDMALDLPTAFEANSATDIKLALTFYFSTPSPALLNADGFPEFLEALAPLLPLSVSYRLAEENGAYADSPEFSCFDGIFVMSGE